MQSEPTFDFVSSLTTLFAWLRDGAIIYAIFKVVFGIGAYWQKAVAFFKRFETHMDVMERFAEEAVTNHFTHLEQDIAKLVGREIEKKKTHAG